MDESVIIKSTKSKNISLVGIGFFISLAMTLVPTYVVTSIGNLLDNNEKIPFYIIIPFFLSLSGFLGGLFFSFSKAEITVTARRVYGTAMFGKRVDLPIDSITAIGTSAMSGVDIGTSSGYIRFKFISNNYAIHSAVTELLNNRQEKVSAPVEQHIINTPISNADELKKYKELLDSGVITQEEFDAKKKQLLGL